MHTLLFCQTSLQTLAITAGGLLTQPVDLWADQPPAPKKLGVALVGLGNYATNQLAPALLAIWLVS